MAAARQIAAMVSSIVFAAAPMAMWGLLPNLRLVAHSDELVVKDILTGEHLPPDPSQTTYNEITYYL
jgi:hypothetical protein